MYVPKPCMTPPRHSPSYWLPSFHTHVPRPSGTPLRSVPVYFEPSLKMMVSTVRFSCAARIRMRVSWPRGWVTLAVLPV